MAPLAQRSIHWTGCCLPSINNSVRPPTHGYKQTKAHGCAHIVEIISPAPIRFALVIAQRHSRFPLEGCSGLFGLQDAPLLLDNCFVGSNRLLNWLAFVRYLALGQWQFVRAPLPLSNWFVHGHRSLNWLAYWHCLVQGGW